MLFRIKRHLRSHSLSGSVMGGVRQEHRPRRRGIAFVVVEEYGIILQA